MTYTQTKIIEEVLFYFSSRINSGNTITEEEVKKAIDVFCLLDPCSAEEKETIRKHIMSTLKVSMPLPSILPDPNQHQTWFIEARKTLPMKYWKRYERYLASEIGPDPVKKIDTATDEILDYTGDPNGKYTFQKRGLVIGDVQSGKTSVYTAIMNKAADAGYKIIILLAGTIEKLRQQTQKRIDSGFIGLDSSALIKDKNKIWVGVGEADSSIGGVVMTSTESDFKKSNGVTFKLNSVKEPVLFVVKKNVSVLEKLRSWLKNLNTSNTQKILEPLLLIDDEADNASVNTKDDANPTAINLKIREILALFSKASYIAVTATPFANIFINPDYKSDVEMLANDLFPSDFIVALKPSNNYIGAKKIYGINTDDDEEPEPAEYSWMLHDNADCEVIIPEKHKKTLEINELPETLKEAMAAFFITNTIMDLDQVDEKHRTMLVNVSRFINVQKSLAREMSSELRLMRNGVKAYGKTDRAMSHEPFPLLKKVFDELYGKRGHSWDEVQRHMFDSIQGVEVRYVNGGNATKQLNYDDYPDGLRVIVVGGLSLSRGLTLKGLSISYYHRNSQMYDTLMQMGRWFGYRPGYDKLCHVWMNKTAQEWYREIATATEELKDSVDLMSRKHLTPRDFGLRVRSDKQTLLVTARNKMRRAQDLEVAVNLSGEVLDTKYLPSDKDQIVTNAAFVKEWLAYLRKNHRQFKDMSNDDKYSSDKYVSHTLQTVNVPKEDIKTFFRNFFSHPLNGILETDAILSILDKDKSGALDSWDVGIATGVGPNNDEYAKLLNVKDLHPIKRTFLLYQNKKAKALQISGKSAHLASRNHGLIGLSTSECNEIKKYVIEHRKAEDKGKNISFKDWFKDAELKRNPVLIIYPVLLDPPKVEDGKTEEDKKLREEAGEYYNKLPVKNEPNIGIAIGIPSIKGLATLKHTYKINQQYAAELLGIAADTTADEFEEDAE